MSEYPEWLKPEDYEKYDRLKKYNGELTLLSSNPNYEDIPRTEWESLKEGEDIIVGYYASTEEGSPNIRWIKEKAPLKNIWMPVQVKRKKNNIKD